MKSIKIACLKFLFLILPIFFIYGSISGKEHEPFVLLTIPRSGSHLAIKTLHYMTGLAPLWHTDFPEDFNIYSKDKFLYTHLQVSDELELDYMRRPHLKKIVNIRDLRDVCISMVSFIVKKPWPGMSVKERKDFLNSSFDEQLLFVINYDYELNSEKNNANIQVSIKKVAEQAVKYSKDPNYLLCRYENLVGPDGGGSKEAQVKELKRIANHIGLSFGEKNIEHLSKILYGNHIDPFKKENFKDFKSTFRKGAIGSWKELFKEEHKEAFKKNLGQALIDLGYTKDNNW